MATPSCSARARRCSVKSGVGLHPHRSESSKPYIMKKRAKARALRSAVSSVRVLEISPNLYGVRGVNSNPPHLGCRGQGYLSKPYSHHLRESMPAPRPTPRRAHNGLPRPRSAPARRRHAQSAYLGSPPTSTVKRPPKMRIRDTHFLSSHNLCD